MTSVQQKWIKIAGSEIDLFQVLDLFKQGFSIIDIAKKEISVTEDEIIHLLSRTSTFLKNHLILDSYMETVHMFSKVSITELKLEWSASEIRELVKLHNCEAKIENIALLMRKNESEIQEKLCALKLITERSHNG